MPSNHEQLVKQLRDDLNGIAANETEAHEANKIVSDLWIKSNKSKQACVDAIFSVGGKHPSAKIKSFRRYALQFLEKFEASEPLVAKRKSNLVSSAGTNIIGPKKQAGSTFFKKLETAKNQINLSCEDTFIQKIVTKLRQNIIWTILAVCAVTYVVVDLQEPVPTHPEVKGWKSLKIGMPMSEATEELRKYFEEIEYVWSDEPTGYECGYYNGYKASIHLTRRNKYLFWNYLDGISLSYDGMKYSQYDTLHKKLQKKYGSPVSDYRDCRNDRDADCSAMFADNSVWLNMSSFRNQSTVSVSYWQSFD